MLEILKRKKVDKQDKQMPQSIEQLIEHYDLEKLWPYIEKIASHVNVNIEGIEDIEKNGVVSGDTVPIGAVMDYDGDTVPENWEEVLDDEVVLYENETGTYDTVRLSETSTNFAYIDLYFRNDLSTPTYGHLRVYNPNGKRVTYTHAGYVNDAVQVSFASWTFNETELSVGSERFFNVYTDGRNIQWEVATERHNYLVKAVGYKRRN